MMEKDIRTHGFILWAKWFFATAIGWIVGVILAIILSHLVVNLFYKENTNMIVGLCIAFTVGLGQMIAARGALPFSWRWIWGSTLGIGIPLLVATLIVERVADGGFEWGFFALGVIGAAVSGIIQAGVLKDLAVRPKCWIGACTLSWGLVWLLRVFMGENALAIGGLIVGAAGGALLVWRVRVIK
jgi:hypothetical protein